MIVHTKNCSVLHKNQLSTLPMRQLEDGGDNEYVSVGGAAIVYVPDGNGQKCCS